MLHFLFGWEKTLFKHFVTQIDCNSLSKINSNCLPELGAGLAAAYANDETELQFIMNQEGESSDDRSYWIGGLGYVENIPGNTGMQQGAVTGGALGTRIWGSYYY